MTLIFKTNIFIYSHQHSHSHSQSESGIIVITVFPSISILMWWHKEDKAWRT